MSNKLRRGLGEDTHFIKRGKFSMESAKNYLIVMIVVFHIMPLFFVFAGEVGLNMMLNMMLYAVNIIVIFGTGLFYGIRIGFNFKFPLLATFITFLSYVFYYNSEYLFENAYYYIMTGIITFIVYAIFNFFAVVLGGWLKRYF